MGQNKEKILFQNKIFQGAYLNFEFGQRLISIESLEDVLLSNGSYSCEEAVVVDEQIFYYVPDSEINNTDEFLIRKIISQI